jgi:hypothetical protein
MFVVIVNPAIINYILYSHGSCANKPLIISIIFKFPTEEALGICHGVDLSMTEMTLNRYVVYSVKLKIFRIEYNQSKNLI